MLEYERTKKIIGDEGVEKLNKSSVLIVGIGGVGGSSLEMLSRSGILNIAPIIFTRTVEHNSIIAPYSKLCCFLFFSAICYTSFIISRTLRNTFDNVSPSKAFILL